MHVVGAFLGAFFLGAVPFSLLLGLLAGVDIRTRGSGNVGATNLGRVCGWWLFPPAFALDFAKGLAPALLVPAAVPLSEPSGVLALLFSVGLALAAVLGHVFSPFLRFRGGKGVATAAGAMTALLPVETGVAFLAWLLVLALTRTVGVASSLAALALPAAFFCRAPWGETRTAILGALSTALAALIVVRHRSNLRAFVRTRRST